MFKSLFKKEILAVVVLTFKMFLIEVCFKFFSVNRYITVYIWKLELQLNWHLVESDIISNTIIFIAPKRYLVLYLVANTLSLNIKNASCLKILYT